MSDAPSNLPETLNGSPHRRNSLTRGWKRTKLIRELAQGEKSQTQLAAEFGVTQGRISQFNKEFEAEIREVRGKIEDQFAALWVADKANRIAEYQADIELINDSVGDKVKFNVQAEMLRVKEACLKAVADELGDIPAKVNVNVSQRITYAVEGVNLENLH